MANIKWGGTVSTDIGDGNNWDGLAFPAVGDSAIWDRSTPYPPGSGTATNAVTNLIISDGATSAQSTGGSMGSTGGSPSWGNITGYCQIANRANHWIKSSGTIAKLQLEMPNNATAYIVSGTVTTTLATNVTVEIVAAAVTTNVLITGATVNAAINGTAITLLQGTGKVNTTSRNITACKTGAGSVVTLKGTAIIVTTGDFQQSILVMQSSGTLPTSTLVAGISLFTGSTLTFVGNPNSTAAGGTVVVYPGAQVVDSVPGCTVTVTKLTAGPTINSTQN